MAIRSPWNTNVMFGGVAWMFIIVFGVLGVRWLTDGIYQPIMTFYVPGVLLTIITQVQWATYKKRMAENEESSDGKPAELEQSSPPRPSARRRRRNPRTGRPRNRPPRWRWPAQPRRETPRSPGIPPAAPRCHLICQPPCRRHSRCRRAEIRSNSLSRSSCVRC